MSRVINPDSAGKERTRLTKCIVLAIRALMRQTEPDESTRDLAAFLAEALLTIAATVDTSVAAWEKRDYWVKADRFRLEWDWTEPAGKAIRDALIKDDWATIAITSAKVGQKLGNIAVGERNRLGTPWVGAYKRLMQAK